VHRSRRKATNSTWSTVQEERGREGKLMLMLMRRRNLKEKMMKKRS
jgi:hypothetical protein